MLFEDRHRRREKARGGERYSGVRESNATTTTVKAKCLQFAGGVRAALWTRSGIGIMHRLFIVILIVIACTSNDSQAAANPRLVRDDTLVIRANNRLQYNQYPVENYQQQQQDDDYQNDDDDGEAYAGDPYQDEDYGDLDGFKDDKRLSSFLDDLVNTRKQQNYAGYNRRGRRRKLNSHEQGILLVEALGKKHRNYSNSVGDYRGHPSNSPDIHNGIIDMLGKSTIIYLSLSWFVCDCECFLLQTVFCYY